MGLGKKYLCVMMVMLSVMIPVIVFATTYVFPYEGFRYTQQGNETVLTRTNLQEHEAFIQLLGTSVDAVLANYISNGIVMEVVPEQGGQISVSVADNPYIDDQRMLEELSKEEKEGLLQQFETSGIYESCKLVDIKPGAIQLTSSATFASMPVYSICYLTMAYGKLYTLTSTIIGRQVNESDDEAVQKVLSGMQMFEARERAVEESEPLAPVPTPEPEPVNRYAELQNVEGNIVLDPINSVLYEDTAVLTGKTDPGLTITVTCNEDRIGQATSSGDGAFSIRIKLPSTGENYLTINAEGVHAELMLSYALPEATVKILEPTETTFTGESILIRGETVPNAIVYFTGNNLSTNALANRFGIFSLRIQEIKPGKLDLTLRSHLSGYTDYTTTLHFERVLTEREQLAAFRQSVITLEYQALCAQPRNYADKGFIFRGRVMEYTDYNGKPCALVCVSNPSTGNWKDPMYIVMDTDEIPEIDSVMTFYLTGEGITLPADGKYTQSGMEEEVPVVRALYLTRNR